MFGGPQQRCYLLLYPAGSERVMHLFMLVAEIVHPADLLLWLPN